VGCSLRPIRSGRLGEVHLVFRVPHRGHGGVRARATVYSQLVGDRNPRNNDAQLRVALT
jgi:hypothetical protein